ncbi:DegT/DnrJ/EryC1/StrS family aminotransferase [Lachnospiraceae bacterium 56-18]
MEFRDLKKQYAMLEKEIEHGIRKVLQACNFISGKQVVELEEQLADYVGTKHCITCANGTDALSLALMAWNIGKGDAVFVPDFTFFSSGEVVSYAGATPVFIDVDKDTFNISVESLENAIQCVLKENSLTPKAIIAVDLFGQPADYPLIKKVAKKYNLMVLEDGAQGFGGKINEQKACSFGDISTTSFFPAKPLGCYGDGGAIFTDDDITAEYLRSLRIHGKGICKYDNIHIGLNSRLDTIQAAILLPKLKAFKDYELDQANYVAEKYTEMFDNIVKTPVIKNGFYSSWAQYSILLPEKIDRDEIQQKLWKKGIPTMVYYPKPMHDQVAFKERYLTFDKMNNTQNLCKRILSLPMHPYMQDGEIKEVTDNLKRLL